ncbi:exopolyphosphatase [Moraxella sp. Tifton1]|uniref:Exopolyphosphatase n=1 Tax=Moraxella oculi TaxID=2940516 RepID=A0ABW8U699_9GAMM|nr:exopolyphosphatase [Moraxella sp. Tifton1]MCL1623693.1 exopolyphosphatase [Moraxella sp. Tifton1]
MKSVMIDTAAHHEKIAKSIIEAGALVGREELIGSIDLGSNSFHLAIARLDHGEIRKVASISEKVQLAAGLDDNNVLSEEAMQRGLDCLHRFAQHLTEVNPNLLRVVATNALRKAVNAQEFIKRANVLLPKPIEIIAGREEARLIYLGVSHSNASTDKRLVIDIGGGSTEFIIGQGFEPIEMESLQMGCVAFTKKFFNDGKITEVAFDRAMKATKAELLSIEKRYKKVGWDNAIASSGTAKAALFVLRELGLADEFITIEGMEKLKRHLIKLGRIDKIDFDGVKSHRQSVFPAGVAGLYAIMQTLNVKQLGYSDGALREGVMYDMLGRSGDEDVRERSIAAMAERYSVNVKQAGRVMATCARLFDAVKDQLGFDDEDRDLLRRAANLHEIGLAIGHSNYQKHSAYLLEFSDIAGFSQVGQAMMAQIALYHRRKLKADALEVLENLGGRKLVYLCLLLRLAVQANQSRTTKAAPIYLTIIKKNQWQVSVGQGLHDELIYSQLASDVAQFAKWGVMLDVV